jgi:hypothetical protein
MRIIHLMTFVFAMLLLAMLPACLNFNRTAGLNPVTSFATAGAVCVFAFAVARRPS